MDIKVEMWNRSGDVVEDFDEAVIVFFRYKVGITEYTLIYDHRYPEFYCSGMVRDDIYKNHDSSFPNLYCPNWNVKDTFVPNKSGIEIAETILGWEKMSPVGFRNEEGDMSLLFGIDQVKYIGNIDEYIVWDEYEDEDGFEKIWAAIIEFCKDVKGVYEKHQK